MLLEFSGGAELIDLIYIYILEGFVTSVCTMCYGESSNGFLPREAEARETALQGWVLETGRIPGEPSSFSGELVLLPESR